MRAVVQSWTAQVRPGVIAALGLCMALLAMRQPHTVKAQLPVADVSSHGIVSAADHLDKTL